MFQMGFFVSCIRVQDASQTRENYSQNTLPDVVFAIFILKKHKSLTIYGEFEMNFKKFLLILCRRLEAPAKNKNRGIARRSRRRYLSYS